VIDIDAWCAAHDVPPVIDGSEVFDGGEANRDRFVGEWSQYMDPEAFAMHGALRDQVRKAMEALGERERVATQVAFGFDDADHDLGDAAEKLGITRDRVRKLEQKSLRILRKRISMFGAWRDECIECEIRERRIEESRRRAAKERDAAYQAAVRIDRMKWEDKVASDRRDRKSVAHVDRARTSPRPALRDSLRPYFEATVRGMRW